MKEYFKDIKKDGQIVYYYYDNIEREWWRLWEDDGWLYHSDDDYYNFKGANQNDNELIPAEESELILELL